jgi:aryl-alcohol dehydrogenase-like predicted oxidoreductase
MENIEQVDYSPFVLGTVQLGMKYGIANQLGRPSQEVANNIVETAWKKGITEFDTAQGYGQSEETLGKAFKALEINSKVKVISKLSPQLDLENSSAIEIALDDSLLKLGLKKLFGLMLHREELLEKWNHGLHNVLKGLTEAGKVDFFGVSVYSPVMANKALNTNGIDFVQLPSNVLDRRFEDAGVFKLAEEKGKKIHIRSVFLQGLILMNPNELPPNLYHVKPILKQLDQFCLEYSVTRQELALGYVKASYPHNKLVFGAESPGQVENNVDCWKKNIPEELVNAVQRTFVGISENILNPALWNTNS